MLPLDRWVENGDFNQVLEGGLMPLRCDELDRVIDVSGREFTLSAGLVLTVFEHDEGAHGETDRLFATGTVVPRPDTFPAGCPRWYLRFDRQEMRHESDLIGP